MGADSRGTSRVHVSFLLGLLGAVVALALHATGKLERLEWDALDLRFRHAGAPAPDCGLCYVEIDDGSLDEVGRWPWPRARLADVVNVLRECGARGIGLDILLVDPQRTRYVVPEGVGLDGAPAPGRPPEPRPVFDDLLLAEAIAAGGVTLPVVLKPDDTQRADPPELRAPLPMFAAGAESQGLVNIRPDADGVVRHVEAGAFAPDRSGGVELHQFGIALARREHERAERGRPSGFLADTWRVRTDDGELLVNWRRHPPRRRRRMHVPAAAVVAVAEERHKLARLDDIAHRLRAELISLGRSLPGERAQVLYWRLAEQTQTLDAAYLARVAAEREADRRGTTEPVTPAGWAELARLRAAEDEADAAAKATSAELVALLREDDAMPAFLGGPESEGFEDRRARASRITAVLDRIPARRAELAASAEALRAQVAGRVDGKLCLVGSTATGAADFAPTPLGPRTPGVYIHGQALETVASGKFIRRASEPANIAAILLAGAAVSILAAWRPVVQAAVLTLVLAAGYAAVNAWGVFGAGRVWLVLAAPLAAMGTSLLVVVVHRELTEERARRRIRALFAHALSPALVDRLVEDPSLAKLGGHRREVTCLFGDLAGFTKMSAGLGPQRTVEMLNRYFDRLTAVVQGRRGGYVNKFLGDGVFCLFSAPVEQADHASRAVRSAVECQAAVHELNAELGPDAALAVRVGVVSGEAMVGNCGSTERMDYTAIGDCVNLASRLESANKFFGSRILVTEETWRAAGCEDLASRPLGRVDIRGAGGVELREVVGPVGELPEGRAEALARMGPALERFAARDFAAAAGLLEAVVADWPDDAPARVYLALARAVAEWPGTDDWPDGCTAGDGVVHIPFPRGE